MSVSSLGIRILEDRVVDQIAAGEVVERPASVVKELVENALDAGATRVDVLLQDGGRSLIQVSDDGSGMSEQDALLAIERHATSKIRGIDDLVGIGSFGFRGEALPSIAAVSRFELTTRRKEDEDGTRIRVQGGKLTDVRPAASPAGTQVRVRSLFNNVPARKAFMRASSTELGHVTQVVVRCALARPSVGFTLSQGGRMIVEAERAASTDPLDQLAVRAAEVLGNDARRLVSVVESAGDLQLMGLASPPGIHRSTGNGAIYMFVNGRWVRDLVLRRAVQQAYRDLVPRGRYPIVVLRLQVPGPGVDVNVHPTKAEVQFRDPASVGSFVSMALRKAVIGKAPDVRPHLDTARPTSLPFNVPPDLAPTYVTTPPPVKPAKPALDPLPTVAVAAEPPAPVAAEPLDEDPAPEEAPAVRWVGVIGERWGVGERDGELWVVDAGRALTRLQATKAAAPGRRLLAPTIVRWSATDVNAVEYYAEALSDVGVDTVTFSTTEVAIRAVPPSMAAADPEALLDLAVKALRRESDVRGTWGSKLPPMPVSGDLERLAGMLAEAQERGVPVAGRSIDLERRGS